MANVIRAKAAALLSTLERRYGKAERPPIVPPPTSADAAAAEAVAAKNAQVVAGVVLGLHGSPTEGADAARKLMAHFVDWNEVRVARPVTLVTVLGKQPNVSARIALLQRFLEAFFLRQRNLNLEYLFTLKSHEVRRFLGDLEVFDREELSAVLLTGFSFALFPPSEALREVAHSVGLIKAKVTALQMAKKFELALPEDQLYALYSYLYALVNDPEGMKAVAKRPSKRS